MIKAGIDQDALINMFSHATAKQGEALRNTVSAATLKALQSRELTVENIRKVLKTVTQASSAGAALNPAGPVDIEAMLGKAFAGMDAALLQAVQANQKALQRFVDQGADLKDKQMKSALDNVEKMEDVFFTTVGKAVQGVGGALQGRTTGMRTAQAMMDSYAALVSGVLIGMSEGLAQKAPEATGAETRARKK
jgi:hypothetical protein